MQQQHTVCDFSGSDSWVILSPIEQSIKHKIESVGTPLKDWDIQINYGIKTGYNDAFIISTAKRNEILSHTADYVAGQAEKDYSSTGEYARTAALIRPILRGRDIKRYGYNWAELWLINTHNGVKENGKVKIPRIDINDYPAVKAHLDTYWDKIKNRADQGDTPYNLRNCAYIDDFNQPKVMWKIIGCNINFSFDDNKMMCNNAVDIMTGNREQLLQYVGLMNSKLFDWYLKLTTEAEVQGGGIQLYVTTLEKTLLKLDFHNDLSIMVERRISGNIDDAKLDRCVFDSYQLTQEEQNFILSCKQVNRVNNR